MTDFRAIAIIALGWLAAVLILGAGPEVALDDSWNYAQMTRHLLTTGQLRFSHYDSALVVLHVLWGAAVTGVLGFSLAHTVLANLLLALASLGAVYYLARRLDLSPLAALWVTGATAAAPPFFVLAFTYMADFAFALPAWLAVAFMVRYLATRKTRDAALAGLLVALSLWSRAHGVLVAAAFVVVLLWQHRWLRPTWRAAALVAGLPAASWLALKLATPALQPARTTLERKSGEVLARLANPAQLAGEGLERLAVALLVLGAVAAPLLAWALARRLKPASRKANVAAGAIAALTTGAAALWVVAWRGELFPFASSVLREWPPLTSGAVLIPWTILAVAGALGLAFLLARSLLRLRGEADAGGRLAWVLVALQVAALVPLVYFMDRYFLFFLPLTLILAMREIDFEAPPRRWPRLAGALLLAVVFAVAGLRVLQVRTGVATQWRAADSLVAQGVDPLTIDGGYSWTGWRNFRVCLALPWENKMTALDSHYVAEICPMMRVRYDVVFHEMDSPRRPLRVFPYADPFGQDEAAVFIHERVGP